MNKLLRVKLLDQTAMIPQKGSELAAGHDLFANQENVVPKQGKALIKTGISIGIPYEHYARIAPRSGLAWKNFIDVGAGVIDEDYRGEVQVVLFNHSQEDFIVKKGDRIAQLILEKISYADIQVVDHLDVTHRGEGGFGSTGVQDLLLKQLQQKQQQDSLEPFLTMYAMKIDQLRLKGFIDQNQSALYQDKVFKIVKLNQMVQSIIDIQEDKLLIQELNKINQSTL